MDFIIDFYNINKKYINIALTEKNDFKSHSVRSCKDFLF